MLGRTLGRYQVTEKLGAGGMGEVWRARDTRLNRDVALKFLPAPFAQDRDRLARFEREAQLLAQLNHPNIGGIHGLEESDGLPYLVLEFVPGDTLTGPLPVEEALAVATQIADAMEEAHGKGIVHRDLKPANIKITPEGKVKVLDFGLAKAFGEDRVEGDPTRSPTLSALATRMGTILGTAAYMSPEQARGRRLDKRTDVWSFGCVLYEMLTGSQAFGGDTVSDCIMAVLGREPDWTKLPAGTPANVQRLLRLCLEKDLGRRLRDIGDAWIASGEQPAAAAPAPPPPPKRPWLPWSLAAITTVLAAVAGWLLLRAPQPAPRQMVQFTAAAPQLAPATGLGGGAIAISPDGTRVAYQAGSPSRLYVRMIDQLEAKPIPGTEEAMGPFFNPDGQWLGFVQQGKLKKIQVIGGATITLCDVTSFNGGASWGHDGTIIFGGATQGLSKVSAAGGPPQVITKLDAKRGDRAHRWPYILPGGKAVLYAAGTASFDDAKIIALSLETGQQRILVDAGSAPRYAHTGPAAPGRRGTGHLIYARSGSLFAVPFDLGRLEVTGSPVPILEGVRGSVNSGNVNYGFSDAGSLVYVPGGANLGGLGLAWVDRQGKAQPIAAPVRGYSDLRLSPEGQRVAVMIVENKPDVWVYDLPRGTLTRLTFQGNNFGPVWTPDGKRVTFVNVDAGKNSLAWVLADGSGPPETLAQLEGQLRTNSWSPDGRVLAFQSGPGANSDILLLPSEPRPSGSGRTPQPFLKTEHGEQFAAFSPDGRWLAYESTESGQPQVYVRPAAAGAGGKWQVSTGGGRFARWARGGRELYYLTSNRVMSVEIEPGPTFRPGTPKELFTFPFAQPAYDVSADGKRFLMIRSNAAEPEAAAPQLHFVLEWFEDIRRRVRAGG